MTPTAASRENVEMHRAIGAAFMSFIDAISKNAMVADGFMELTALLTRQWSTVLPGTECLITVTTKDDPNELRVLASRGEWADRHLKTFWSIPGTLASVAMATVQPMEWSRTKGDSEPREPLSGGPMNVMRLVPYKSFIALPDGRKTLGIFAVYSKYATAFTLYERQIIDAYADLIGVVVLRGELREVTVRSEKRLRMGIDMAVELTQIVEHGQIMVTWLQYVVDAIHAQRGAIIEVNGDQIKVCHIQDNDEGPKFTRDKLALITQPLLQRAINSSEPQCADRFSSVELCRIFGDPSGSLWYSLVLPVVIGGNLRVLLVAQRSTEHAFNADDIATAKLTSEIAALAVQNADRYVALREQQSV